MFLKRDDLGKCTPRQPEHGFQALNQFFLMTFSGFPYIVFHLYLESFWRSMLVSILLNFRSHCGSLSRYKCRQHCIKLHVRGATAAPEGDRRIQIEGMKFLELAETAN